MHQWVLSLELASPSSFVLLLNSNSFKNLSISSPHTTLTLYSVPLNPLFFLLILVSTTMVLLFRLFLLLLLTNGSHCFGDNKILNLQKHQWKNWRQKPSCHSHKSRKENGATILEMKHRDHCSGETKSINDWNKELKKRLIMDDLRVRSLQSKFKTMVSGHSSITSTQDGSNSEIPLTSGITLDTLNYIVQVGIGGRNLTVIVDTGSDLTWVQCQPCKLCYSQKEPLLSPSLSPSYQPLLCNSSTCQSLQLASGNLGICGSSEPPSCNYAVSYGDGSYSRGDLGSDRLNLGSTPVDNFVFGCGRNNKGLFGGASGLMGLGKSNVSLVTQTSTMFGGVFSYCLPTTEAENSGSLVLGGNASVYKNSTPISYTNMIMNPQLSSFYFLNLTGISIGGVALQAPKTASFATSGMLIDSGTVITRLPPSMYNAMRDEFLKQFTGFPSAPGYSILDTCFNLSGFQEVNIPTIKIHFDGNAELTVDVTGIFYFVKTDASQVCLALASLSYDDEIGIIGNFQQKNQRVIYDTKESKLGFAGEMCSFV